MERILSPATPPSGGVRIFPLAAVVCWLGLLAACTPTPRPPPLPSLGIALGTTTVSGLSSGGYMAVQYQVAFAGEVKGAGIFAAGPWGCARGRLQLALQDCVDRPQAAPPVPLLLGRLRSAALAGDIAPTTALADDRIWLFRGVHDQRVAPGVMTALERFYAALIPASQINRAPVLDAGHALPTESTGSRCQESVSPFLAACRYDGAGAMLATVTGTAPRPVSEPGELLKFDQRRYDDGRYLDRIGYVYVPAACRGASARCGLHIAFHGCQQGASTIGEAFVRDGGYRRAADRHGVVVLFPQVGPSYLRPFNPKGCWDWWGYSGANYLSRQAAQLSAVHAMAEALALTPAP